MKAAVIGAGHIARQHLACLCQLENVTSVSVCDLSPAMAEAAAERFRTSSWYTDHRRLLDEVKPDVVHICTPVATHARLAGEALDAGMHVLVEKPAATKSSELEDLLNRAAGLQRLLVENYNYLYNSQVRRIMQLIDAGAVGDVVHVDVCLSLNILDPTNPFCDPNVPNALRTQPGGVIADLLTHLVALAHLFVGPVRQAKALWTKRSGTVLTSDEMQSISDCERGSASIVFSAHAQPDQFWLRVHGTRMRASANLFETYLSIERLRGGSKPLMPFFNALSESKSAFRAAFGGLWRKLEGGPAAYEGLWELIRRTYSAVEEGGPPPVTPQQMREVNQWIDLLKSQDRSLSGSS